MNGRMSPEALARACADAMWAEDAASQGLGMELELVAPGEARMAMTVRPDMVNGHGIMHGGFIFTLADSAFAFACNTYGEKVVAQHCSITFLKPGRLGDRLTAHAVERSRSGRSGIYDIRVTNGSGEIIAEFRGHSRTIGGRLLEESAR